MTSPSKLAALAKSASTLRFTFAEGVKTAFWEYGSPKASAQQEVVLVHGYRGNHHGLEAIAGSLVGARVLIPDLPGYGLSSEFRKEHSIENYARWLARFVGDTAPGATIVGHSFGSIVVAAAAAKHGLTNDLVLLNPVCRFADHPRNRKLQRLTDLFYRICEAVPSGLGQFLLANPIFVQAMSSKLTKTLNLATRFWIHQQHLTNFSTYTSLRVALEGYRASITSSVTDFAPLIANRTLLVTGLRDDITSNDAQRRNAADMTNAQLVELEGVGHLTHYEQPEAVARAILKFLRP